MTRRGRWPSIKTSVAWAAFFRPAPQGTPRHAALEVRPRGRRSRCRGSSPCPEANPQSSPTRSPARTAIRGGRFGALWRAAVSRFRQAAPVPPASRPRGPWPLPHVEAMFVRGSETLPWHAGKSGGTSSSPHHTVFSLPAPQTEICPILVSYSGSDRGHGSIASGLRQC